MASEEDIRQLFQRHGYELIKVKRCKTHDNIHFRNDEVKVTVILKVHIEALPLENAERLVRWLGLPQRLSAGRRGYKDGKT